MSDDRTTLVAELRALEMWLRDGEAYMEHPDGETGAFRAADAVRDTAAALEAAHEREVLLRQAIQEMATVTLAMLELNTVQPTEEQEKSELLAKLDAMEEAFNSLGERAGQPTEERNAP